jgi:uncharacterized membrane-anchored protein
VNLSIAGKERLLAEGRVVYLELAPVDPRSLMQGDYMALNYRVANEVMEALPRKENQAGLWPDLMTGDGRIVVVLDERSVGTFARLEDDQPLAENEVYLRYRVRLGRLKFASNAFFFQEGQAGRYEGARFGKFRVGSGGELLLTALHGEDLAQMGQ